MPFKYFTNYREKGDMAVVGGRRRRSGLRDGDYMLDFFQLEGKIPEEMDKIKIRLRGACSNG